MINNTINLKMDNGINVIVDKGLMKVSKYEIEDHLIDLLKFKRSYQAGEKILLSAICDVMFDLIFCGRNKNTKEIIFKLC